MEQMDNKTVRPRGTDSVRVISVVEVTTTVGDGMPGNPMRTMTEYWSLSGARLAVRDSYRSGEIDNASSKESSASMK